MSRRPVIDLERDLPARPKGLTAESLSMVFGGCQSRGFCDPRASLCCPTMGCNRQADLSYTCSWSAAW